MQGLRIATGDLDRINDPFKGTVTIDPAAIEN